MERERETKRTRELLREIVCKREREKEREQKRDRLQRERDLCHDGFATGQGTPSNFCLLCWLTATENYVAQ